MKILVVDDDPDFLALFLNVLSRLGFGDVLSAPSGASALEKIASLPSPVDCFILDIQMPEMDGIELTRRIRALAAYDETPIIMNTVMSDRKHIDAAFQAGATDYLTKPVDVIEIQARLGVISTLVKERHDAQKTRVGCYGVFRNEELPEDAWNLSGHDGVCGWDTSRKRAFDLRFRGWVCFRRNDG